MSQQKNKKDNRDSDYGSTTDTQTAGAGKTENAFDTKDENSKTSGTTFGKKDEGSETDSQKGSSTSSDKKNLDELGQQISKSSTKSDFGSSHKKYKNYEEENDRLTGEGNDSDRRFNESTTGSGQANQQTDFRRGTSKVLIRGMTTNMEIICDLMISSMVSSRVSNMVRIHMVSNGINRDSNGIINPVNGTSKVNSGTKRVNSGINRVSRNDMANIPDSSGAIKITDNKIRINGVASMEWEVLDNIAVTVTNTHPKEITDKETDTIKVLNMDRDMARHSDQVNIQDTELNMVHSNLLGRKIIMVRVPVDGMIPTKTDIKPAIVANTMIRVLKEEEKKEIVVPIVTAEEKLIHKVVQQDVRRIINMADH